MANPFSGKAKPKKNPLVKKAKKSANPWNGKAKKSSIAKPKKFNSRKRELTIDDYRKADGIIGVEIPEETADGNWADKAKIAKRKKAAAASDKEDFTEGGIKYQHVREHDGFWTVEVSDGNNIYRFDNRKGWMCELIAGEAYNGGGREIYQGVIRRWYQELRRQKRRPPYHTDAFPAIKEEPKNKTKNGRKKKNKKDKSKPNPFAKKKG